MHTLDENRVKSEKILSKGMFHCLFPDNLVLTPQLNEVYELALAYYESKILSETELIQNGAYFARVGNQLSHHYHMCTGESLRLPQHSSSRLKSFFEKINSAQDMPHMACFPIVGNFTPK